MNFLVKKVVKNNSDKIGSTMYSRLSANKYPLIEKGWVPEGLTKEDLNQHSILWNDANIERDLQTIIFLVNYGMSICSLRIKKASATKIVQTIRKESWKEKYHNTVFVFLAVEAQKLTFNDMQTMLFVQALEILFHIHFPELNPIKTGFGRKCEKIFELVYGREMQPELSETLRIMRNLVVHTGEVTGITDKLPKRELSHLSLFKDSYYSNTKDTKSALVHLSVQFCLLSEDMILRCLGLTWNELGTNLNPPFAFFKKHDS